MASSAPSPATGLLGAAPSTAEATADSCLLAAAPSTAEATADSGLFTATPSTAEATAPSGLFVTTSTGPTSAAVPSSSSAAANNCFLTPTSPPFGISPSPTSPSSSFGPVVAPTFGRHSPHPFARKPIRLAPAIPPGFRAPSSNPFGAAPATTSGFRPAVPSPFGAAPATTSGFRPAVPLPIGAAQATTFDFGPAITKNVAISVEDPSKIDELLPKLRNAEYYTIPTIEELADMERLRPGYLSRVKNFVVGRYGYGSIMFPDETDVRGVELNSIVVFNHNNLVLFPDGKGPPVGLGLNKTAVVTLLDVKYYDYMGEQFEDGPVVEEIKDLLRKTANENSAEFLSYDPALGVWKFIILKN